MSLAFEKEEYWKDNDGARKRVLFYRLCGNMRETTEQAKSLGDWCRENCAEPFEQEYGDSGVLWFSSAADATLCRIRFG